MGKRKNKLTVVKGVVVYYVDNCSSKTKKFKNLRDAIAWADDYTLNKTDLENGYWVDQVVDGEIFVYDGCSV